MTCSGVIRRCAIFCLLAWAGSNILCGAVFGGQVSMSQELEDTTRRLSKKFGMPVLIARQYDLRTELTGRTESFTQDEVRQVQKIVFQELEREDLEKYHLKLILLDNQHEDKIIIVFAMPDKQLMHDGESYPGRTYHIKDNKLINVIKTTVTK